jgi:hypothetical protein
VQHGAEAPQQPCVLRFLGESGSDQVLGVRRPADQPQVVDSLQRAVIGHARSVSPGTSQTPAIFAGPATTSNPSRRKAEVAEFGEQKTV